MKKALILTAAIGLSVVASYAANPSTGGTLSLTGEVDGSIALVIQTSETNPITLSGANTNAATATISAVSYFGTSDNATVGGFVKTHDSNNIILTGNFDVVVSAANVGSESYSLTAALESSDLNTWVLDGTTLSTATSAPLSQTASYGSPATQTLKIKVPTSVTASSTAIQNVINLTATAL